MQHTHAPHHNTSQFMFHTLTRSCVPPSHVAPNKRCMSLRAPTFQTCELHPVGPRWYSSGPLTQVTLCGDEQQSVRYDARKPHVHGRAVPTVSEPVRPHSKAQRFHWKLPARANVCGQLGRVRQVSLFGLTGLGALSAMCSYCPWFVSVWLRVVDVTLLEVLHVMIRCTVSMHQWSVVVVWRTGQSVCDTCYWGGRSACATKCGVVPCNDCRCDALFTAAARL